MKDMYNVEKLIRDFEIVSHLGFDPLSTGKNINGEYHTQDKKINLFIGR